MCVQHQPGLLSDDDRQGRMLLSRLGKGKFAMALNVVAQSGVVASKRRDASAATRESR